MVYCRYGGKVMRNIEILEFILNKSNKSASLKEIYALNADSDSLIKRRLDKLVQQKKLKLIYRRYNLTDNGSKFIACYNLVKERHLLKSLCLSL